ncbi:MAG: Gfo/Idh/MocA family oxidoreductase [Lentisphaeria bacterium]|nr:Gfo/Idh/MocA family oxidoreductase [Lentisphaeria bacterium]
MRKASLAVVGCGKLAQNQHISNIIKSKNARLHTFCDLDPKVLEDLTKRFPGTAACTDVRRVLTDPEIDGVVIATREDMHVPLAVEALAAGKYVYVEKPLAETPEECEKVITAEKVSGKKLLVGMNRRMAPAYRNAREILNRNGGARAIFYRIADAYAIDWGKNFGPGKRLLHEVCHIFDICRFLTGSDVRSVYCLSTRRDEENIVLEFESGATAMILSSGYAPWETPKEHLEAVAEVGVLTVDEFCELNTYGMPGEVPNKKYPGHSHVEKEQSHVSWIADAGLAGIVGLRRMLADRQRKVEALDHDSEEYRNGRDFLDHRLPHINYSVDKGWLGAIEHFADVILDGVPVEAATAEDALAAARITRAAVISRAEKRIVAMKDVD